MKPQRPNCEAHACLHQEAVIVTSPRPRQTNITSYAFSGNVDILNQWQGKLGSEFFFRRQYRENYSDPKLR